MSDSVKAYAIEKTDKLCRVERGGTLNVSQVLQNGQTNWRVTAPGSEDAPAREAWERLKKQQDRPSNHAGWHPDEGDQRDKVPDGYMILRGPGVVECEEEFCQTGFRMIAVVNDVPSFQACQICNPHGLEHPTLVPLAECEEMSFTVLSEHVIQYDHSPRSYALLAHKHDLAGIAVVREEECALLGAHSTISRETMNECRNCKGTGKVEKTEFFWREVTA